MFQSAGLLPPQPAPGSGPGPACERQFMFSGTSRLILGLHLRRAATRLEDELDQQSSVHEF